MVVIIIVVYVEAHIPQSKVQRLRTTPVATVSLQSG